MRGSSEAELTKLKIDSCRLSGNAITAQIFVSFYFKFLEMKITGKKLVRRLVIAMLSMYMFVTVVMRGYRFQSADVQASNEL